MEIVVTVFAAVVAAGCFFAVLSNDIKEAGAKSDSSGTDPFSESKEKQE